MLENDVEFYDIEKDIEYYDIDFSGKELGIQIQFIGFWISLFAKNTYWQFLHFGTDSIELQ